MPVTKSATKKLRQDRKKEQVNDAFRDKLEIAFRKVEKKHDPKLLSEAISLLDKSVKKNLIHENKSNRLKSKLAKLYSQKQTVLSPKILKKTKKSKTATSQTTAAATKRSKSSTQVVT